MKSNHEILIRKNNELSVVVKAKVDRATDKSCSVNFDIIDFEKRENKSGELSVHNEKMLYTLLFEMIDPTYDKQDNHK